MSTPVKSLLKSRLASPRILANYPVKNQNLQVFKCVEKSDNSFLINTPNKMRLLKYGVDNENVLDFLGHGRFGTVFKGKYKGDSVAVKVVRFDKATQLGEDNALAINHENIIKILDVIKNSSEMFVVILMEYYPNSINLQSYFCRDLPLTKKMIVNFCKDIVRGLIYCHELGIFHLDIKPKNILLCNETCKICDFGNSYRCGDGNYNFNGTLVYASPEILSGKIPTHKCDVYSFGIFLWQMLARKLPYESMNIEVVIYKVVKFSFRPNLEEIFMENAASLKALCGSCWQETPNDRPELNEIVNVLEENAEK